MIYINLPLNVYVYILNITLVCIIVLAYYFNTMDISLYFKSLFIWLSVLLLINFYNMRSTLKNYMKNIKNVGPKGIQGNRGPRGYTGEADICGNCKPTRVYYGGEINDKGVVINNKKLKMGYCKFPFVFNNILVNKPVLSKQGDEIADAQIKGWCATSVNDDLTYKTYGYCRDSDKNINNFKDNKTNFKREKDYIDTNSGIIDLKLISEVRSNIKCPDEYTKIESDLNYNANGNYVYLCKKYGTDDLGVTDIKIINGEDTCSGLYSESTINLNDGVPNISDKNKIKMCVKRSSSKREAFIKDINIINGSNNEKCKDKYKILEDNNKTPVDLNQGTTGDKIYMCITRTHISPIIDAAFIWNEDNNLYFFINDKYWKLTSNKEVSGAYLINNFWGKIITDSSSIPELQKTLNNSDTTTTSTTNTTTTATTNSNTSTTTKSNNHKCFDINNINNNKNVGIDAIYSDFFDNKTYIFKGNYVYSYDKEKETIEDGYPKKITDIWDGFPDNIDFIDSIYSDKENNTIYFIKNNLYYKLKGKTKKLESAKNIKELYNGIPDNIIIKAIFNFNKKKYLIESEMVYEIDSNNNIDASKVKTFNDVFTNILLSNKCN